MPNEPTEKPQQIQDLEDTLLIAIILTTVATWLLVLVRLLTG
jgi:hypothetical protein